MGAAAQAIAPAPVRSAAIATTTPSRLRGFVDSFRCVAALHSEASRPVIAAVPISGLSQVLRRSDSAHSRRVRRPLECMRTRSHGTQRSSAHAGSDGVGGGSRPRHVLVEQADAPASGPHLRFRTPAARPRTSTPCVIPGETMSCSCTGLSRQPLPGPTAPSSTVR